ncbi:MAG: GIY-YIG nuclease family protein [Bacteroidota bacterium]
MLGKFQWKESILRVNVCEIAAICVCRKVNKDRTNEARTKEHQTGNPRGIYPVDEIISVPFVERLETHIHYEFNERWISGEWFLLTDTELNTVVDRAKVLQAQQFLDKPIIENALLKLHILTKSNTQLTQFI